MTDDHVRYRVRLVSAAHYENPVPVARHILRVRPRDDARQSVSAYALEIEPAPARVIETRDFFGNAVTSFTLDAPHDHFVFRAESDVALTIAASPDATPAWDEVRAQANAHAALDPDAPAHYLYASRIVALDDDITAYAAASFAPGAPIFESARDLAQRIHREFVFDAQATEVTSSPRAAFDARQGVCQDFAHIMIGGLRGLGLPARYASGFLRTLPPPGAAALEGADAMHAWIEIWCGAHAGWIGLDPTNDMPAGSDHILVAVGRDYADVAPETGVIVTQGKHRLEIAVDVRALTEAPN